MKTYKSFSSIAQDTEGKILALVAVFAEDGATPEILGETSRRKIAGGERILEGCLGRSLKELHQAGFEKAEADGHISDPHWFPTYLKTEPEGAWFRLCILPLPSSK